MDATSFFEFDFPSALFPLKTNLLLMRHHAAGLSDQVKRVLSTDAAHAGDNFFPQLRVYAAKPRNHLRRTVILDPISTFFVYDVIARNASAFAPVVAPSRRAYGYHFENDHPIPVHRAYKDFSADVEVARSEYRHSISFDVASYFNSIYHHDATNWFASLPEVTGADVNAFGRFFREINGGRSIDFLPQGIYPTKMIGSGFLAFIETSGQLKCAKILRFMDDIYLFDDDEGKLISDFHRVQELLGLQALNINPTKTVRDGQVLSTREAATGVSEALSTILGESAKYVSLPSGMDEADLAEWGLTVDDFTTDANGKGLDEKTVESLLELLADPNADEADAEIILGFLREKVDSLTPYLADLFARFPNIAKQLYNLVGDIHEKDELCKSFVALVKSDAYLIEYQLFWLAVVTEDHLSGSAAYGELLVAIYERSANYKVALAKILEIPTQDFGFKQIRSAILNSGSSDWPAWAAAMGTRSLGKAERNQQLKYFGRASTINHIIADCVINLP